MQNSKSVRIRSPWTWTFAVFLAALIAAAPVSVSAAPIESRSSKHESRRPDRRNDPALQRAGMASLAGESKRSTALGAIAAIATPTFTAPSNGERRTPAEIPTSGKSHDIAALEITRMGD